MIKKKWTLFVLGGLLCVAGALLSIRLGAAKLSLAQLWDALLHGAKGTAGLIFWYSRLPRTAACLLSGAALAVSGCILQGVLGNRLASPHIIGVNAGAGLAVTVCCAAGVVSGWAMAFSSFGGAMLAAGLVYLLARRTGASRTTVILAGVAMNSILNAFASAVRTLRPDTALLSSDFQVGDFSSVSSERLLPAGILILCALAVTMTLCNDLDVLSLGEDAAQSLGLRVKRTRALFLLLAALLAGASVSFAGLLGFVGLIVPHAVRAVAGSESRYLLPLSALFGAGFVTVCDLASRLIFAPYELPVGILMALVGGPFFLVLLLKRKGGRSHD